MMSYCNRVALCVAFLFSTWLTAQNWQPANGHFGWNKKCALVTQSQKIMVGCDSGRVMVSADEGFTWDVILLPQIKSVRSLAQTSDGNIYAGLYNGGVYRSPDDGQSWIQTAAPDSVVRQVCALPDGSVSMVAWNFLPYAFRSFDMGVTWDTIFTDRNYMPININVSQTTGEIFLSTYSGLYISADTGTTWIFTDSLYSLRCVDRVLNTNTLWAAGSNGVYESNDNGLTWNNAGFGNYMFDIISCTADGKVILGYPSGQFGFSLDGGNTWATETFPGTFQNLAYYPLSQRVFFANNISEGVPRFTIDGTTTASTSFDYYYAGCGIYATNNCETFTDPFDTVMYAGGFSNTNAQLTAGFYRSTDNGKNWNIIPGTSINYPTCYLRVSDSVLLMGTTNNGLLHSGVFRSTDNGFTWNQCGLQNAYVHCIIRTTTGKVIASGNNGTWASLDDGLTWTQTSTTLLFGQMYCNPSNGMIAAKPASSALVHYSSNDGATWSTSVSFPNSGSFMGMNPVTGTLIMTASTSDLSRSTNGGINWQPMVGSLPAGVHSMRVMGTPCGEFYLTATDGHMYQSVDDGLTWVQLAQPPGGFTDIKLNGYNTLICDTYFGPQGYQLSGSVSACSAVWPGDANHDRFVSGNDLFSVALANGQTGFARASVSNSWAPNASLSWNAMQFDGTDLKHADCNGDGMVNNSDTTAIILNYSNYHPARVQQGPTVTTSVTAQLVCLSGDTVAAGDMAVFALQLSMGNTSFAGTAFRINSVGQPIDSTATSVTYFNHTNTPWISIRPASDPEGIEGAICRNNQTDTTGVVMISGVIFVTDSSLTAPELLIPTVLFCQLISSDGSTININVTPDSVVVMPGWNTINENHPNAIGIAAVPNPGASPRFIITGCAPGEKYDLNIFNAEGQLIESRSGSGTGEFIQVGPAQAALIPGIYFLVYNSETHQRTCRFVISGN